MIGKYFYIFLWGCLVLFSNCNNKQQLTPKSYMVFANETDNGLTQEKLFNHIVYKLKIQPAEFLTISKAKEPFKTQEDYLKALEEYKCYMNFTLIIEDEANTFGRVKKLVFDKAQYSALLAYANQKLNLDFELKRSNTISNTAALVHLEAANSVQPSIRITGSFKLDFDVKEEGIRLRFDDNLFANGPINFYYDKDFFKQLPEIKI